MTSNEQYPLETPLGKYAGFVTRLVAWTIDRLLLTIVIAMITAATSFFLDTFRINQFLGFFDNINNFLIIFAVVLVVLLPTVYDIGMWILAGQTLGKRIMGVRVVKTDGQRINFWSALLREIGYYLSAILFLGYLWILFDNRRQGFHDKLAHTFVVYSWPEVAGPIRPIADRIRASRSQPSPTEAGNES